MDYNDLLMRNKYYIYSVIEIIIINLRINTPLFFTKKCENQVESHSIKYLF